MSKSNSKRFWMLLVALLVAGGVINAWEHAGEAKISRRTFTEFPAQIGSWQQKGADEKFDGETERVLGADDYLSRNYQTSDGRYASLYVGYYASQRTGATFHSPLNCLPGSGWVMSDGGRIAIASAQRPAFEVNRYVIQNGNSRAVILYWYEGRGRTVASEYWGKIYTVIDSVRRRRSDGAMVRVMVPISASKEEAEKTAIELASQAVPELPAYVPN